MKPLPEMLPPFLPFLPTAGFPSVSLARIASYAPAQYLVREQDTMIDLDQSQFTLWGWGWSLALFKHMAKHSSVVIRIKLGYSKGGRQIVGFLGRQSAESPTPYQGI